MLEKIGRALKTFRNKKSAPLHIEFNLTDYCNLNCRSCTHYSPVASEEYEDMKILEDSMRHISQVKNSHLIEEVYLIGGETLLYPSLTEVVRKASEYFPWAKINIFTNGLLLPRMDDEFWTVCRETQCVIALTRYPLKVDYDKIEALAKEKGAVLRVFGDRGEKESFFRFPLDPEKKQNGRLSHFKCLSFGCITIEKGRIFPCSQAACIGNINRRFGTNFQWEDKDFIKVVDLKDAKELLALRSRPIPFCKYCKPIETIEYGPSRRDVSEWVDQ